MSFTRTRSGLSNLALFHSVDLIVFTEGGEQSFSFDEVEEGKFNKKSVDIKFWSSIFVKHNYKKSIEFRALGSKTSSRKICELIISKNVSNIVVVLDSDLDDFSSDKFESPYILYTRGYSWENDVYHPDLVKEQIESLIFMPKLPLEYCEIVDEAYQSFDYYAPRLLRLELIFRQENVRLITDCQGERFINGKSIPRLKMEQINLLVKERKITLNRPVIVPKLDDEMCPVRYCYGKLRESLAIAIISYVAKKLDGMKSLPKEVLVAAMIERYRNRKGHQEDKYYEAIVNNLIAA